VNFPTAKEQSERIAALQTPEARKQMETISRRLRTASSGTHIEFGGTLADCIRVALEAEGYRVIPAGPNESTRICWGPMTRGMQ
jgi:hypothetical protein